MLTRFDVLNVSCDAALSSLFLLRYEIIICVFLFYVHWSITLLIVFTSHTAANKKPVFVLSPLNVDEVYSVYIVYSFTNYVLQFKTHDEWTYAWDMIRFPYITHLFYIIDFIFLRLSKQDSHFIYFKKNFDITYY